MAQKFDVAQERLFGNIYICRKCNAKNRTDNPEETSCRKCGYSNLRHKNEQFAG